MSKLKQLAGDTVIYGVSSILGRVIFVLLSKLYTNEDILTLEENGVYSILYTLSAFLLIFFGFGLETAFFRYALKQKGNLEKTLATALSSILGTTIFLTALCLLFSEPLAQLIHAGDYTNLVQVVVLIVAFDTLTSIPFAYLRAKNQPIKFAAIKLSGILLNVALNLFFYLLCPYVLKVGESHILYEFVSKIYNPNFGVGYAFLANVIDAIFKLLLLLPVYKYLKFGFDPKLWKNMLRYGWPIMLVLFGSMINEVADRQLLTWLLPGTEEEKKEMVGIYHNCYKFSVFLALFTQAFRYAGEPFFFSQSAEKDARQTYADVLKYFTIFTLLGFLFVGLNLNFLKHIIITSPTYYQGFHIIPILLMAYVFSGMYYNLSIWYKLTDQTFYGAIVALIGAAITILLNILFIPKFGYLTSAWTTFACFFSMFVIAYFWGQKHYPVPYNLKAIFGYIIMAVVIYLLFFEIISQFREQSLVRYVLQFSALIIFVLIVYFFEGKQVKKLTQ